ncbi:phage tail protein [Portibacter marinus]|uniref:phage tail protein n=1 Tax=Portibacter marinus TaxID=2898660 RepID=UPI001F2019AB|nr:phage tail protein [Portibacter marinus]
MASTNSLKYPVAGYHFKVVMGGTEMAFKEVSGLSATIEYKQENPGGDSTAAPKKFDKVKPGPVSFKKGLVKGNLLSEKILDSVFNLKMNQVDNEISHQDVTVTLMNEKGDPVAYFLLTGAYPTKWEISSFDAMSKELTLETIVLECTSIYVHT